MKQTPNIRLIFCTMMALFAIGMAPLALGQKHIRSVADKVRDNDQAGADMTNIVKRDPATRSVSSTLLQVNALSPKIARSMAKAIDMDEKDAFENRKSVTAGMCTQVLKFFDGKSEVSVVFTYNVKNYSGARLVFREDFVPEQHKGRVQLRRMSCDGGFGDADVLFDSFVVHPLWLYDIHQAEVMYQ